MLGLVAALISNTLGILRLSTCITHLPVLPVIHVGYLKKKKTAFCLYFYGEIGLITDAHNLYELRDIVYRICQAT